jgi:hypothetical protein
MALLIKFSDNLTKGRRIGKLSKSSRPLDLVYANIIEGRTGVLPHSQLAKGCPGRIRKLRSRVRGLQYRKTGGYPRNR